MVIEQIRELAQQGKVRITLHARREMDNDMVFTNHVLEMLESSLTEIVEDYPEDPRGHSHLLLGWLADEEPLHICCAMHEDELIVITVYRPDPMLWESDWRKRK